MKTANRLRPALVLFILIGITAPADAAEPAADPTTLWKLLGIPQGLQKLRDVGVNRRGNLPKLEQKPPLKRIADPENLKSQIKAIEVAAKIKTQEDMAPQKIKAIKYLATIGCGCYPDVQEALLKSLDDCTEEVRYQAAIALREAAGDPCEACGSSCCSAAVMTKLHKMAHGQDEKGCPEESSARVRAAAEKALNACRERFPTTPTAPSPDNGIEYPSDVPPIEAAPSEPPPNGGGPTDMGPPFIEEGGLEEKQPGPPPGDQTSAITNPISLVTLSQVGEIETSDSADVPRAGQSAAGCAPRRRPSCGPGEYALPEEPAVPWELGEAEAEERLAPPLSAFASALGAASGPQAAAPNMIGDFFGCRSTSATVVRSFVFTGLDGEQDTLPFFFTIIPGGTRVARQDGSETPSPPYTILNFNDASARLGGAPLTAVPAGGTLLPGGTTTIAMDESYTSDFRVEYTVDVPCPHASVVGRLKIAENTSPIPRDRLLFNYSFFDGVPLAPGGIGVHRFTPGFEKTFCHGLMSFEMKIPMALTLDNNTMLDGVTNVAHEELGNMGLTLKGLLLQRRRWALSLGLTVAVPTADDVRVALADGTPLVQVRNEAVHIEPFFGVLWTPNDRFFAQGFMQWDVAANGNPVLIDDGMGGGLTYADDLHDATLQYLDLGGGYWIYRGHDRFRRLTGLAWTAELHWNRSLEDTDVVTAGNFRVGDFSSNFELFNLTVGAHLEFYDKTTVSLAYTTPLGGGQDQQFDGEFRLMVNRRFGPQTRAARTPLYR